VSGREFIPNPAEIVLTARLCCLSTTSVTLGDSSGVKNKKQTVTQETSGHMKLSAWAQLQGLSYKTAWRLWKAGQLPVLAEQLTTAPSFFTPHQRTSLLMWPCTPEFPFFSGGDPSEEGSWVGSAYYFPCSL